MKHQISQQAGKAFLWKVVQHGGTKIIFLVRLLVLARLLTPDDFGLLAVSMVLVDIMSRVTDFGMIPALVQRSSAGAVHYHTAWSVGIIRAVVIAGIVVFTAPYVAQLFQEPRATSIIQVLAIRPILEAAASIRVAELTRDLRFRPLTFLKLPEALTNTVVAIALAHTLGVWALVAGALAGPFIFLILSYVFAPYRPHFSLNREAAQSLINFGRWIFLISLIAVIGSASLRLVITRQLGTAELGLYFLGASLAFLPTEITSQVIGEVTFPLYSRLQENLEKVSQAFQSVLTGIYAVLMPISVLLIALAPAVVSHVLGPKWAGTEMVIRVLALASLIGILGETIVPILKGLGAPSKVVVLEVIQSSLLVAGVLVFTSYLGLVGAAMAWLFAIFASQLAGVKFLRDRIPIDLTGLLKPLLVIAGISAMGGLVAAEVYELMPGLSGFILGIALSVGGMGWMLWISDKRLELGLAYNVVRAFPRVATLVGYEPGKK